MCLTNHLTLRAASPKISRLLNLMYSIYVMLLYSLTQIMCMHNYL